MCIPLRARQETGGRDDIAHDFLPLDGHDVNTFNPIVLS